MKVTGGFLQYDVKEYRRQIEGAKKQAKSEADALKTRLKCQKIARRIMKGDIVPQADYRYLLKNDPGLYTQAVSLRVESKDPKKHDRLSKDEKPEEMGGQEAPSADGTDQVNIEA